MLPRTGFHYFLSGFKWIFQPGIKRYIVIPLLLNILLFIALFFIARHFMGEFNHWMQGLLPAWLQWLSIIMWLLFGISFVLAWVYTYVMVANLIAAPFNSLLSEKVTKLLGGTPIENEGWVMSMKDILRSFGRQFSFLAYYLPRAIGLGILFFIPLVQFIAPVLWFLFNAWFMALQYVDYPTDLQRIPLRQVRHELNAKRVLNLSFGMSVLVGSMIPVVNLFAMPAAVAGATELWFREYSREYR